MHDLEADVDDPLNDDWDKEEDLSMPDSEDHSGDAEGTQTMTESTAQLQDVRLNGSGPERLVSVPYINDVQANVQQTTSDMSTHSDSIDSTATSTSLFERRNAGNHEYTAIRLPSGSGPFLRPITPTEPLMSGGEATSHTPTTDMLANEGPMTPTNTAGPFVFDGSAGRASTAEASTAA